MDQIPAFKKVGERRWRETDSSWVREELGRYQSETPCEACHGYGTVGHDDADCARCAGSGVLS